MAELIKVDKNGTKYFEGYTTCTRCNGVGIYFIGVCNGRPVPSPVDGGTCFECGGSGKVLSKWKEYTPEHEAKLEARRQARRAKLEAEIEAKCKALEEEEAKLKAEAEAEEKRIAEERAKSNFIGKIGERLELEAVYLYSAHFEVESYAGFGTETMYIHNFKVGDDAIIWKTTASLGKWNDRDEWESPEEGDTVVLKGTVKEHSEYKGQKQTILTRCKIK